MRSARPRATYRLQLHAGFTFEHAVRQIDYFERLGVSHLYLSPIGVAGAHSMHGYDVADHTEISPALGGEAALRRLARGCHAAGLGLILDIVPNHMKADAAANKLWWKALANGLESADAECFDFERDQTSPTFDRRIVLPILGEPYGDALYSGNIKLLWDETLQQFAFCYGPHMFPVRASDATALAGGADPARASLDRWRDPAELHALLERQHFRLCWWRAAGDLINWRRFFDVNELVALRVEDATVFQMVHAKMFRLYADGVIDGVRVDHIDGLADPAGYAQNLRTRLAELTAERPADSPRDGPWVVVEKILGRGEALQHGWPVDGTTGYDFMDEISALLHDPAGAAALDTLWHEISGRPTLFDTEEIHARREILETSFAGQLSACAAAFAQVAEATVKTRDLTYEAFRRVLTAFVMRLRIYRTYATGMAPAQPLDAQVADALRGLQTAHPAEAAACEFLADILQGKRNDARMADPARAVRLLNQLTAPVAAKAVEDTAFYRYGRLLSRNDVGFDAAKLGFSTAAFITSGNLRACNWPLGMLAVATHDHKRGPDVRARLAVLSEVPDLWRDAVHAWFEITRVDRPDIIAADDAYMLFQTLVGAWPFGLSPDDAAGLGAFGERLAGWREKSLREAKLRSSWAAPDAGYEAANMAWLRLLLDPLRSAAFLRSLTDFVDRIAAAGAINGMVQAAVQCIWPGVPDIYQGAELWDLSLVDPDNRRPVDYEVRRRRLADGENDWMSGAVKQAAIARILALRRADPELFHYGSVEPLGLRGRRADHVLAFQRRFENRVVNCAAMLRVARATTALGAVPDDDWWGDTHIEWQGGWQNAGAVFGKLPVRIE
jgi:(1->4)-alpha-D-glucan 1-alpha-D-glucosylmutase